MLKRTITKKWGIGKAEDTGLIIPWTLSFFVVVPAFLFWLAERGLRGINRERIELLLPLGILGSAPLAIALAGMLVGRLRRKQVFLFLGTFLAICILAVNLLTRPPAVLDYLWFGFGRRVVALSVVVGAIWSATSHRQLAPSLKRASRAVIAIIGLLLYLPAFVQPPWGIINLGDASHQVMEEISGPLVGHFPGVNFVATYTTLLGTPLLILRPLNLGHLLEMSLVVGWVNILVLALPVLLVAVGRSAGAFRSWIVGLMFVVPPLMASGKWGAAASNTESLSMIPGRTLLPVGLGLLAVHFLPRRSFRNVALVGFLAVMVGFNNIEFGVPATAAAATCALAIDMSSGGSLGRVRAILTGSCCSLLSLFGYSLLVSGKYDFWFRVGSYAGTPYSPAELFPVWSIHNLLLGLFATSIVSGALCLKRLPHSSLCGIYFGIWGLASFPYCSYRCLEGMYMATQVYFIPAIGAALGIVGCLRGSIRTSQKRGTATLPILVVALGSVAIGCLVQAPNPRDEWKRVLGLADNMPWASEPRRGLPSRWDPSRIDWLDTKAIVDARDQIEDDSVGYFGYMGNSVQLATGINNLSRINSSEVLLIKGTKRLEELACREVEESRPKYVILVGMDFPCGGYQLDDQFVHDKNVQILVRDGQ